MQQVPSRAHRLLAVGSLILALGLTACNLDTLGPNAATPTPANTPTPKPTSTAVPQAKVVVVSTSVFIPDSGKALAFSGKPAICPPGEPMLGGGFSVGGAQNVWQADVTISYPSSPNTWITTVSNAAVGGSLTLYTYAYCLQANFPVSTKIVTAPVVGNGNAIVAACPGGSIVTGAGYKNDNHFRAFRPASGISWTAQLFGAGAGTVYVICAKGLLKAASLPTAVAPIAKNGVGLASVGCPAGQLMVGGGYSIIPPAVVITDAADNVASHWRDEASDRSFGLQSGLTVTSVGICVKIA